MTHHLYYVITCEVSCLEHRIEPLMNQLAESLIYKQPIDPRAYLIDLLQELIEAREKNTPPNGLLDRTNIAAIFGLIDIMGRGRYMLTPFALHTNISLQYQSSRRFIGLGQSWNQ